MIWLHYPELRSGLIRLVDGGRSLPRVYNEISRQIKYLQGAEKKPVRGPKPTPIELSHQQRGLLEQIVRRQTSPQNQVRRAKIILCMGEGKNNQQTAQSLKVHRETVQQWRSRWLEAVPQLTAAEVTGISEQELLGLIEAVFWDEPRAGTPVKFAAEQVVQIIAIACETPQVSGRPISQWSAGELADEAIKRGIVETISPRSVERFLKRGRPKASPESVLA